MGANAISRPRTQPDPLRVFAEVKGSPFDSIRPRQTVQTALEFPDTEEATSSNLVPPTRQNTFPGPQKIGIWPSNCEGQGEKSG